MATINFMVYERFLENTEKTIEVLTLFESGIKKYRKEMDEKNVNSFKVRLVIEKEFMDQISDFLLDAEDMETLGCKPVKGGIRPDWEDENKVALKFKLEKL